MARATVEWIGKTDDEAVPPRVKLRIFEDADGKCKKCSRKLRPGHWDTDHIVAIINGGQNRESNLQPLCDVPCHSQKTKQDVREKSRSAKARKKNAGMKKPRTITSWRKFNGEVVRVSRERSAS